VLHLGRPPSLASLALAYGPLLLLGFAAGALRALGRRAGLTDRQRRRYGAAWVALLLVGAPLWLVLAALLRL
jgi:hypothetical protein